MDGTGTKERALMLMPSPSAAMESALRRCMAIEDEDDARHDFGDMNGGRLQRPSEVAAELVAALQDEGYELALRPSR